MKESTFELLSGAALLVSACFYYYNYQLEQEIVRDNLHSWLSVAIPSVAMGGIYFWKERLWRNEEYTNIYGIKRTAYKVAIFTIAVLGAAMFFGSYLNVALLWTNKQLLDEESTEEYFAIERISGQTPGLSRNSDDIVPEVEFSNGELSDDIQLVSTDLGDIPPTVDTIVIASKRGFWGIRVAHKIILRSSGFGEEHQEDEAD